MKESISQPHKQIGVAVIWNDRDEFLIDRRLPKGVFGGLWEFPGGKLEPGETVEACIEREIREELGIGIAVGDRLIVVEYDYEQFKVTLNVHHCRHLEGDPQPLECAEVRWVSLDEIEQFTFPPANVKIIEALRQWRGRGAGEQGTLRQAQEGAGVQGGRGAGGI